MNDHEILKKVERLTRIIQALLNRSERAEELKAKDFDLFRSAVLHEEQLQRRTEQLESLLEEKENVASALRESEAKFRAIVDQSLVGLSLLSLDSGLFSYVNERFADIVGYTSDQLLTMNPFDITPDADAESLRNFLDGSVVDNPAGPRTLRTNLRKSDGTLRNAEVTGSVLRIKGEKTLLSVWTDVTERVQAEKIVADLTERLSEEAIRDALTGLYNRRFLEEALQREILLACRKSYSVSVIMVDIDFFKLINDRHGHQVGDDVLRVFSDLLQKNCRKSDVCCRFGGEEFLIVMPETSLEFADERAEAIRKLVEKSTFPSQNEALTASFGVASYNPNLQNEQTPEGLILQADQALYAAKANGRNRVITA